jgi:hemoglobin-like flavoprotein
MMATEQIDSTQFHDVQEMAIADIAAQLFCNHLLERDARLKQRVCGGGGQQERKLMQMIRRAVEHLAHAGGLAPALRELGKPRATRPIESPDYIALGAAFVKTLERRLGAPLLDEVREAWAAVYSFLAAMMQATDIAA